jgi:hypothetical protein
MKIIKCRCSNPIHIFGVGNSRCPFCGNVADYNSAVNDWLGGSLSFLDEKISRIDECIKMKDSAIAKPLIDDVLEWMPGWKIGEKKIPRTGEIYWRKLLVETGSRNDVELLFNKSKHLNDYSAFENAKEYANNHNERRTYELIEITEWRIVEFLEVALAKNEPSCKRETGVERILPECKKLLHELKSQLEKSIVRLEVNEKELREQVIDCEIVAGEHKYALNNLLSQAQYILNNNNRDEISKEEKKVWEAKMDIICKESDLEYKELQNTYSTHLKFCKYNDLVNEQLSICEDINIEKLNLDKLVSRISDLVSRIEDITEVHDNARMGVRNGNYALAKKVLTPARFEEVIRQAFEGR